MVNNPSNRTISDNTTTPIVVFGYTLKILDCFFIEALKHARELYGIWFLGLVKNVKHLDKLWGTISIEAGGLSGVKITHQSIKQNAGQK